jgi:CheY-like chemotaxis protein
VFRVAIPLARHGSWEDYEAAALGRAAATPADERSLADREAPCRILLAEDHPINRRVVELILAPFGVEIVAVENGALAVEAMRAGRFDLVLMDMQMPVMDGLAATRAIRREEAGRRTPIVMLSANAMSHHRLEAMAAGADLHVAKPVTPEALIAGVVAALDVPGQPADERDAVA